MNVSELKEFSYYNAHQTGNSFIRALFSTSKILTTTPLGAFGSVVNIINAYNNERTGSTCKWDYLPSNNNYAFREMLEYSDVNYLNRILDEVGQCEYSVKNCYTIIIHKDYSVTIKTYAFINMLSGAIGWIDVEQAKLMIARKITFLKKP